VKLRRLGAVSDSLFVMLYGCSRCLRLPEMFALTAASQQAYIRADRFLSIMLTCDRYIY